MDLMVVSKLTKRYGDQLALSDVSFSVRDGEILGLIGPNGAGKTTLMECVAGLRVADEGTVAWRGAQIAPFDRKAAMFYMPDGIEPFTDHPVRGSLEFWCSAFGQDLAAMHKIIASLELHPVLHKEVGTLSKGYRRRLLLALALLTPHDLVLVDEPFDGLDLKQTLAVGQYLRVFRDEGRTFLLSIHQLTDAERVCDRFVLLSDGVVKAIGDLAELRATTQLPGGSLEDIFLAIS